MQNKLDTANCVEFANRMRNASYEDKRYFLSLFPISMLLEEASRQASVYENFTNEEKERYKRLEDDFGIISSF